jgi:uncharacterized protein (UPF0333 family)
MKFKRAQTSIEYFILFGTLLFFLMIIIGYFIQMVPEEISFNQATATVNKIARAVETIHSVGPGARRIIYVNVPPGTQYINITPISEGTKGEISLTMNYKGEQMDFFAVTSANITGNIPPGKIFYKLLIQTTEDWIVNITSQ